jgi:ribosomal protein S27E
MYRCLDCGETTSKYNYEKHEFSCSNCGSTEKVEPKKSRCPNCFKTYIWYTQGDPSYCQYCNKSFVE